MAKKASLYHYLYNSELGFLAMDPTRQKPDQDMLVVPLNPKLKNSIRVNSDFLQITVFPDDFSGYLRDSILPPRAEISIPRDVDLRRNALQETLYTAGHKDIRVVPTILSASRKYPALSALTEQCLDLLTGLKIIIDFKKEKGRQPNSRSEVLKMRRDFPNVRAWLEDQVKNNELALFLEDVVERAESLKESKDFIAQDDRDTKKHQIDILSDWARAGSQDGKMEIPGERQDIVDLYKDNKISFTDAHLILSVVFKLKQNDAVTSALNNAEQGAGVDVTYDINNDNYMDYTLRAIDNAINALREANQSAENNKTLRKIKHWQTFSMKVA